MYTYRNPSMSLRIAYRRVVRMVHLRQEREESGDKSGAVLVEVELVEVEREVVSRVRARHVVYIRLLPPPSKSDKSPNKLQKNTQQVG